MFSLFNPFRCVFCGSRSQAGFDVCLACEKSLPWTSAIKSCQQCGIEVSENQSVCGDCLVNPPAFDRVFSALTYDEQSAFLLQHLKFYHQLSHARIAGQILTKAFDVQNVQNMRLDMIIPVPLHWRRQLHRGFNQSHEIARIVQRHLCTPINTKFVRRVRHTKAQSTLSGRARNGNVEHAFAVDQSMMMPEHVMIIDDVVTTGATVNALSLALKNAGVMTVTVGCVARVMGDQ